MLSPSVKSALSGWSSLSFRSVAMPFALAVGLMTSASTGAFAQEAEQPQMTQEELIRLRQERLQEMLASVDPEEAQALADILPDLNWIKLCGVDEQANQQVCEIRAQLQREGVTVGIIRIIEAEGGERQMTAILPNGLLIPQGVRAQVDGGAPLTGQYQICLPQHCVVAIPIEEATIDGMKGGAEFTVTALNQAGRAVPFAFSLAGFTAAYDGEGYDSALLRAAEQINAQRAADAANTAPPTLEGNDLQNALEERAREVRERLQDQ